MSIYLIFTVLLLLSLALLLMPVWRTSEVPRAQRQFFIVIIAVVFLGGGLGLYHQLGAPEILPLMEEREQRLAGLKEIILHRSADIKANPNDLRARIELGESYMQTAQYAAAVNQFKHAVLISDGNPVLIMAYAKAQIALAEGKVTDDANKALEMVLLQQPQNDEAHYWLAVRLLQEGHTQEAMKAMKALYHSLPQDSPVREMIDRQIGRSP